MLNTYRVGRLPAGTHLARSSQKRILSRVKQSAMTS